MKLALAIATIIGTTLTSLHALSEELVLKMRYRDCVEHCPKNEDSSQAWFELAAPLEVRGFHNHWGDLAPAVADLNAKIGKGDTAFYVYTKQELDKQQAAQQGEIASLQEQVRTLIKNVKTLSETNDALTSRIETLEKTSK
jgi:uncharacterized coiled-coil protein SlyX